MNLRIFRSLLTLCSVLSFPLYGLAQLPPNQPEQDCINALPVCQNIFTQPNSYVGGGSNPNEINPVPSCLNSGENNDVWYIFTVQVAGNLCFTITPNNGVNDYDWAVYNLTNNNCSDIFTTPSLEVSCNYAPNLGCGGATGPNGNTGAPCGGQNQPCIPVQVGQTYVVNVSNFSSSNNGYTINFSASTAVIFDNTPPSITSLGVNCSGAINMTFSENVLCNTVSTSDFTVTDLAGNPYTINNITGQACSTGGTFENQFLMNVSPAFVSGDYIISLVGNIQDNCGNAAVLSTDTLPVVLPNIAVTFGSDTICAGSSTTVSTPAQPGYTYLWSTGQTGATITVSPLVNTTYTVSATAPNACVYTGSALLTVIPVPTATFTVDSTGVCPKETATFTYTGTSLPAATFQWSFDGANSVIGSGAGPYQVSWDTAGLKTVTLVVSQYGCTSVPFSILETVYPLPTADFLTATDVCVFNTTGFLYNGTAATSAIYNWDFDFPANGPFNGVGPHSPSWDIPGPKNVCLIVTENGCISLPVCKPIQVNPLPSARIADEADQCLKGNAFSFQYGGTSAISDYFWAFGEPGAQSTLPAPNYTYLSYGPKTVFLTVTDAKGCVATDSQEIVIHPPVTAAFDFQDVCFGVPTPFVDASFTDPIAPINEWSWTFGDAGSSSQTNPFHTYGSWGEYATTLIVSSIHGCKDTLSRLVQVYDEPIANFEFKNDCDDKPISFTNSSTFNDPGVSYAWLFGNGAFSIQTAPSHIYGGPGDYDVTLVILNDKGCADSVTKKISVYPLPNADFTSPGACLRELMQFENLSTVPNPGRIADYRWDFGDGNGTNNANPLRGFNEPGIFPVELLAITQHGCLDSITKNIEIYPVPFAQFDVASVCALDTAFFTNLSTVDGTVTGDVISNWSWNFGDGGLAGSILSPVHIYSKGNVYPVTLSVETNKGCTSVLTRDLLIFAIPEPPAIQNDTVCFGDPAFLLAVSGPPAERMEWFAAQNDTTPFHVGFSYVTPALPYPYTFYVQPVSPQECRGERLPVYADVYGARNAFLQLSDSVVEIPQSVVNMSVTGLTGNVVKYTWDFGDGSGSDTIAPVHEYRLPGKYVVHVTLTTDEGCEFTLLRLVEVKQPVRLHIPSAFTPNGDGYNDAFYIASQLLSTFEIHVYNRWGQEVFVSNVPDFRWDGYGPDGKVLPQDVYVYRVSALDIQGNDVSEAGTITILR
ncbi:MAG: PKD domain-containing protein [Bacteroidetes bacterium]|nr:MAG: PKD domain-containing protein [Bacteroidota bacterium]